MYSVLLLALIFTYHTILTLLLLPIITLIDSSNIGINFNPHRNLLVLLPYWQRVARIILKWPVT